MVRTIVIMWVHNRLTSVPLDDRFM